MIFQKSAFEKNTNLKKKSSFQFQLILRNGDIGFGEILIMFEKTPLNEYINIASGSEFLRELRNYNIQDYHIISQVCSKWNAVSAYDRIKLFLCLFVQGTNLDISSHEVKSVCC